MIDPDDITKEIKKLNTKVKRLDKKRSKAKVDIANRIKVGDVFHFEYGSFGRPSEGYYRIITYDELKSKCKHRMCDQDKEEDFIFYELFLDHSSDKYRYQYDFSYKETFFDEIYKINKNFYKKYIRESKLEKLLK